MELFLGSLTRDCLAGVANADEFVRTARKDAVGETKMPASSSSSSSSRPEPSKPKPDDWLSVFLTPGGQQRMLHQAARNGLCESVRALVALLINANSNSTTTTTTTAINTDRILRACLPMSSPNSLPHHRNDHLRIAGLVPPLLPFQRYALDWLLMRETITQPRLLPRFCCKLPLSGCLANQVSGLIQIDDESDIQCDNFDLVKGGVLADEMGLGKTVEILALILSHPPSESSYPYVDRSLLFKLPTQEQLSTAVENCALCKLKLRNLPLFQCYLCTNRFHVCCQTNPCAQNLIQLDHLFVCNYCIAPPTPIEIGDDVAEEIHLLSTAATLIITPLSILGQWISEIKTHCPELNYYWYKGRHNNDKIPARHLSTFSVVLTTYDVLRSEIHLARGDSTRSRRHGAERRYARPRSPLIEIEWWRCVLDEAQMVESSTSATAEMARIIPRIHPWAVTGTPVSKNGLADLKGLCIFLKIQPIANVSVNVLEKYGQSALESMFCEFLWRNTKENVKNELLLPKQSQFICELGFSAVERSYYDQLYDSCIEELERIDSKVNELKLEVEAISELKQVEIHSKRKRIQQIVEDSHAKMRSWILQLRQICCHPQIGGHNQNTLGSKVGTIEEVLEVMQRHSESAVISTERLLINQRIEKAHLFEFLKDYERGITIYKSVLVDIRSRIQKLEQVLTILTTKKGELVQNEIEEDYEEGIDGAVSSKTAEYRSMISNFLHAYREFEHQAIFFIACCYNSLQNEELENKYYDQAETLRRSILGSFENEVKRNREFCFGKKNAKAVALVTQAIQTQRNWRKGGRDEVVISGIVIRQALENVKNLTETLNAQWDQAVSVWRKRILKLINTDLINNDEETKDGASNGNSSNRNQVYNGQHDYDRESTARISKVPTGEEYSDGADIQIELNALMDAYADILSERRELLNGVSTVVPKPPDIEFRRFEIECQELRAQFSLKRGRSHLSAVLKDLKGIVEGAYIPTIERHLAASFVEKMTEGLEIQLDCVAELQRENVGVLQIELIRLRKLANARIDFYSHLQEISDSLVTPQTPVNINQDLESLQIEIMKNEGILASQIGRFKYLQQLSPKSSLAVVSDSNISENLGESEETEECIICKATFDEGFITECGHLYCNYCMQLWVAKRHQCALCKNQLKNLDTQLTRVTFKKSTNTATPSKTPGESDQLTHEYKHDHLPANIHDRISAIKLDSTASYGTKTDFLLQHLLYIQKTDPTAKALLFSQWEQVLNLVAMGCDKNGISYRKLEVGKKNDTVKEFRENPNIKLFMLNARSQSSGLTLVGATHVFLMEPVVNPGMEMQEYTELDKQKKPMYIDRIYTHQYRQNASAKNIAIQRQCLRDGGGEYVIDSDLKSILVGNKHQFKHLEISEPVEEILGDSEESNAELGLDVEGDEAVIMEDAGGDQSLIIDHLVESQQPQKALGTGRRGQKRRREDNGSGLKLR
ncbi:hypothetical protein HK100_000015 [Physocladia obscura]|uniref:RING-type domain-containing protein n=1 Tax=Physocladia obscura TaxID=109957 RepID=A0AAD5TG69_9FUNG|nr:hypothetical protein HK100_000015 [Physocladia obscura]